MESIQAFRFAYMENVAEEGEENYYEEEIAINLKCNGNITSFDGEEVSYLLIKM
jgi:hypothetical protein